MLGKPERFTDRFWIDLFIVGRQERKFERQVY